MAPFPRVTLFFLVSCTLTRVCSGALKRDPFKWPKPPCAMYHPVDPYYESSCPNIDAFVCATNGQTYKNECFFCIEQWEFGSHIQFDKYGKCG